MIPRYERMTMKEIYEIIQELRQDNSSNYKIKVLEKHKGNYNLKRYLQYCYNQRWNYWITKLPEDDFTATKYSIDFLTPDVFYGVFDKLRNRELTGHSAIEFLAKGLNSYFKEGRELFELVIARDIKAGVSIKTINKVFPDLLPEVPYMRCSTLVKGDMDKIFRKGYAICQLKSDGIFSYIIKQNDKVSLLTRAGTEWDSEELTVSMQNLPNDIVLVGEALIKDGDKVLDRKTGNGLINSFIKRYTTSDSSIEKIEQASEKAKTKLKLKLAENMDEWNYTDQNLHFSLWDILTVEEFEKGFSANTYQKRFTELSYLLPKCVIGDKLSIIPSVNVETIEEAMECANVYMQQGLEGAILKSPYLLFENKTSRLQVKIKAELDCDLLCIGVEEGTGKYMGMIGSLICESSCGKLKVNVGTGLNEKDRAKNPDEYIGKILTVKYNEKIKRKDSVDIWSLFLPVYIETRIDKNEANSLEEIE